MPLSTLFNDLHHFAAIVLLAIGALLPIVDPLGGAPIYLAMTAGLTPAERDPDGEGGCGEQLSTAHRFDADRRLRARLLRALDSRCSGCRRDRCLRDRLVAVEQPRLAIGARPQWAANRDAGLSQSTRLLPSHDAAYRGSISVALTLGANPTRGLRSSVVTGLAHALGILIVAVAVYLCYRYADRILKKLGATGTSVVVRLSAFILLCIGVQICWNGLHALLVGAFPNAAS